MLDPPSHAYFTQNIFCKLYIYSPPSFLCRCNMLLENALVISHLQRLTPGAPLPRVVRSLGGDGPVREVHPRALLRLLGARLIILADTRALLLDNERNA